MPFEQRVAQAMQSIYALRAWTPVQRKWLERLGKQLAHEVVMDVEFVNRAFARDGGAKQVDKLLGGNLNALLASVGDLLWQSAA
jgi:type I restriction enzyme R subunit